MTWSISFGAGSKEAAKRELTLQLPAAMLHQKPHARDFDLVKSTIAGAVDLCVEGAISVSASGHLSGEWVEGDIPNITGVTISSVNVYSTPAAA